MSPRSPTAAIVKPGADLNPSASDGTASGGGSASAEAARVEVPGAIRWHPVSDAYSARYTITVWQGIQLGCIALAVIVICCLCDFDRAANVLNDVILAFYALILLHRAGALCAGLLYTRGKSPAPVTPTSPLLTATDSSPEASEAGAGPVQLPVYVPTLSVMVPMYREASVLPQLCKGLQRMHYPVDRLQVLLLLEEDDLETQAACRAHSMPDHFRMVIVPPGKPRTKPRACNYGLSYCTGEVIVIFDAEDKPEPDQFLLAAEALALAGPRVACVQARLAFYNPRQNILTRLFATEYLSWFGIMLPGLHCIGAPIPLGGTSNYFRADLLREAGGWDSWNVAEDCDLGMRLYRRGFRVEMLNSTTWEEACPEVPLWIRQRSRWVKGYLQTWLVHTRRPLQLVKELGPWGCLNLHLVVGGTVACLLLNPLYWLFTLLWWTHPTSFEENVMSGPVLMFGNLSLILGNVLFIAFHCAGAIRRRQWDLIAVALLVPFYWLLMSVAAWKALKQIIFAPHFWEKTRHGLAHHHD